MARVELTLDECEPGGLPMVCMKCGQPAEAAPERLFRWRPSWSLLVALVGLLLICIACGGGDVTTTPLALLAFLMAFSTAAIAVKECSVWTPLCPDHADYWLIRAWFIYGGLFAVLGSIFGMTFVALTHERPVPNWVEHSFLVLGAALLLWAFVALIVHATSIRPVCITATEVHLTNVHTGFIAALERQRHAEFRAESPGNVPEVG